MALGCVLAAFGAWPAADGPRIVLPAAGDELYAPSGACFVKVLEDAQPRGLRARLYAGARLVRDVEGAREMAWIDDVLVFAVSPAGGEPGVYAWDCTNGSIERVVKPERSTHDRPQGTDFFRLVQVDGDVLYYARAPDGDSPSRDRDLARNLEMIRIGPPRIEVSTR